MKISATIFFGLALALGAPAFPQECTSMWVKTLQINPETPEPNSMDTFASYGLLAYENQPNLAWVFKGEFPKARFMSIETYTSHRKRRYDVQFDYQMLPDAGSRNPFEAGVPMDTPNRSFTVKLIPGEGHSTTPNVIYTSPSAKVVAVYYRIYSPNTGLQPTAADMPRIFAVDSETGEPVDCPVLTTAVFKPHYPNFTPDLVAMFKKFEFKQRVVHQGQNSAIPGYVWAMNRVRHGDVTVIRFKAPTFFDNQSGTGVFQTTGDVRYWSFCTLNFVKNQTLNCVPDYLAPADASGWVTIVVGKGDTVREAAAKRGFTFLEDLRQRRQHVEEFAYRMLLPNPEFAANDMYQGDYLPKGVTCTADEFLATGCP